ncbi:MAG: hypothetical protein AMXMBFR53_42570 [Gemmatimonadota bacterium]
MQVTDAQRDVRVTFRGGFMGQLVSGLLWLASAALATWGTPRQAITLLVVGGFFIFPVTVAGLKLLGHRGALPAGHPFNALAVQVALTLPLSLPVVGAAALYRLEWFYPAFMVVLGAHYFPFVFLYGMRMFAPLCFALVGLGVGLALYGPGTFALGAWITAALLLAFSVLGRALVAKELPAG